jgi:PAS domain S-box-containing protein
MSDQQQQTPHQNSPTSHELFRLIVESATDIAIIAMNTEGVITSWNVGAERLLGWSEEEAIGQSADMLFTTEERDPKVPNGERSTALADGRAVDERWHQRKDGSRFWGSGLMMPLTDRQRGFVKIFRDRTEKHRLDQLVQDERERFRLLATNIPQLVFRSHGTGSRIWGSPQWIVFTGLGQKESVEFGWLDAIHADDREATIAAWSEAQGTGEYYMEHRIQRQPDGEYRWHQTRAKPAEEGAADDWVGTSADIDDLRTLQDRQQVLMAELQHRTRNLLAVVQSVARQTLRTSASLDAFGDEFESRLRTLGRVQGLLARVDHQDIDVRDLVESELSAHDEGDGRMHIKGPSAPLPANSAQALALAIHELATNAVKYGALHQPGGQLSVAWTTEEDKGQRLVVLDWIESGVTMPEAGTPRRKGYGSELIERALPYTLKAKTRLEFGPDGVRCRIATPAGRFTSGAQA